MKKFKAKLFNRLSGKVLKPINKEESINNILTIGVFVFIIITTFWIIDIVFGLLSDSMNLNEIKYVLLLIRDYVVWFVLALLYIVIARKKQFNNESVFGLTALGSIYTGVKLYMAELGYFWLFAVEWIIITAAIYNIVRIIFKHLAKPVLE
ncbi:hypothetical protein [Sedimentibacter sp.]|uniref:hypothetical protein n=1 Tax=Sedimentibacter sp. TaxID=1960295 RepID=UPI0028A0F59E|nr:hypothetical protein [Sedimentibacter sp.]